MLLIIVPMNWVDLMPHTSSRSPVQPMSRLLCEHCDSLDFQGRNVCMSVHQRSHLHRRYKVLTGQWVPLRGHGTRFGLRWRMLCMNTTNQPVRDALSSLRVPLNIHDSKYGFICSHCQTLSCRNIKCQRETVSDHLSRIRRSNYVARLVWQMNIMLSITYHH